VPQKKKKEKKYSIIEFSTICGFRQPLEGWNTSPADKRILLYFRWQREAKKHLYATCFWW
jgi:hypothetical protein